MSECLVAFIDSLVEVGVRIYIACMVSFQNSSLRLFRSWLDRPSFVPGNKYIVEVGRNVAKHGFWKSHTVSSSL